VARPEKDFSPPRPIAALNYLLEPPVRLILHDEILGALRPDSFVHLQAVASIQCLHGAEQKAVLRSLDEPML